MDLRAELLPPVVAPARLDELRYAIERVAELWERGDRDEAARAVATFNADTGHSYTAVDFIEFAGWRDRDDFVKEAARPAWPRVPDVTPAELAEVVRRIQAGDPETDYYVLLFRANVVDPNAVDLIFHPPAHLEHADAEEIVAAALAYRPIAL